MGKLKKPKKAKKTGSSSALGKVKSKAVGAVSALVGGSKGGGGGRKHKKSAAWYAREIARLKLKKRYDRLKLGGY